MGRKNFNSYIKKQKQEKKRKKLEEKKAKMEERRSQPTSSKLEDMIAYVDEYGVITSKPPGEEDEKPPKKEKK